MRMYLDGELIADETSDEIVCVCLYLEGSWNGRIENGCVYLRDDFGAISGYESDIEIIDEFKGGSP